MYKRQQLDIEEKAKIVTDTFFSSVGGKEQFDDVCIELVRSDKEDPQRNEEAFARLRVVVKSRNKDLVGRLFNAKMIEIALANIPGFGPSNPIGDGASFLAYWPALIDSSHITEYVHVDEEIIEVSPTSQQDLPAVVADFEPARVSAAPTGDMVSIPFGRLFGTRSGDKGGCANLGVWAKNDEAYGFLHTFLTIERLKALLPDTAEFEIDRYELANVRSLNFFIKGILGEGVASSVRTDPQAKTLGEYLRAKTIDVPAILAAQVK